jgi:geranylgeranyl pyrophosphate synthase
MVCDQFIPLVYELLWEIGTHSDADPDYTQTLGKLIEAARASEQQGISLTMLPLLTCQACGGEIGSAVPVAAAWRALHIAAKLLDDAEDGDVTRMAAAPSDFARIINLATGFIAIAGLALNRLPTKLSHVLQSDFNATMLRMAGGQHIDISCQASLDLEHYFQLMGAKSGACFALAARTGARCATTDAAQLVRYEQLGYNIGILIQIIDDLEGFHQPPGMSDLATGHHTLPVVFSLSVAAPSDQVHLKQLLAQAPTDREAEAQAHELIHALGGEVYLRAEMARYRYQALATLTDSVPTRASPPPALRTWLDALFRWCESSVQ